METETGWLSFGMAGLGSWLLIAAWTIGIAILAWWFYMPNPMAKDRKDRNKEP